MICVTGSGGTLSSEVIQQLESVGADFRGAYRRKEQVEEARKKGRKAVIMDYNNLESIKSAFEGCDKIFLLGPNLPNQIDLELKAVEAAKAAGVSHIVKQSVFGAMEESYSLAKIHRTVEKAIEATGLDWTFTRPNSFMQNTVTYLGHFIRTGSAFYSASDNAKISHVDARDIAAIAVKALTESGHTGKAYTISGPEALSYDEIANKMTEVLGRNITHVHLSPEELKAGMLEGGMPEEIADRMLDLERYFREGKPAIITNTVKEVTGREANNFSDFIRETAAKGVWDLQTELKAVAA